MAVKIRDIELKDLVRAESVTLKFIYRIEKSALPWSEDKIKKGIHVSVKINDIIKSLKRERTLFKFHRMSDRTYQLDLELLDSDLPEILSEFCKIYHMGEGNTISEIVEILNSTNPCGYDQSLGHSFYEYKIKKFLSGAVILTDSNYSGIKQTDEFKDYLFNNTKLAVPDGESVCRQQKLDYLGVERFKDILTCENILEPERF